MWAGIPSFSAPSDSATVTVRSLHTRANVSKVEARRWSPFGGHVATGQHYFPWRMSAAIRSPIPPSPRLTARRSLAFQTPFSRTLATILWNVNERL
jgi:hypothetical protein